MNLRLELLVVALTSFTLVPLECEDYFPNTAHATLEEFIAARERSDEMLVTESGDAVLALRHLFRTAPIVFTLPGEGEVILGVKRSKPAQTNSYRGS